ncbi:TrlF family AAA-like ATPase [Helicobacter pylori]|uniref:TrlF family AAA-like ATPase n=1 Tax=Helicobacter pylori TaxID=210 RepID=UPI00026A467D|nr:PHP-associated domain-containing protein [Helicobacter pylori]EJB45505.1 ATPase [Helicobacter pylori Hp A-17]
MGNKDHSKGSSWHKWDLHAHTPYTNLNKEYKCSEEEFIQKLCDSQIDCIGLTNYFKFNEKEFDLKEKIEKKDIKVFYNLEVRLDYQNKEDQCLDFHIIFSDKVTQQEIDNFLRNADANVGGTEKKLADLEKDDFDKAVVNFDQLLECLEKESLKLRGKYLLGFLSRGHGNSRSSSNHKKIVKKAHFLIHSSNDQENLKKDREFWLEYNKPLLQSSDAHKEEQIGNKYTWIKAEKTFEGLKQIIYEPKTRVSIDENKPQDPLYKIDCVGLNFDKAVKIANEKGEIPFCYAGFNETLFFSPYFTCVIGGRGSGKSTLLQLIASAIKNKSFVKGLEFEAKKYIEIQPDIDIVDSVEYLAQNEVEEFATNVSKFTEAIFNRMDSKSSGTLKELEKQITKGIEKFDEQIACWQEKTKLGKQLKESEKIRNKYQNIINTFTDKDYLDKKGKLQKTCEALIDLRQSKEGFLTFIKELKRVVNFESKENYGRKNSYDKAYNQLKQDICKELEQIDINIKNGCFKSEDENIMTLETEHEVLSQEIGEFLKEKGVSDENIGDIRNANYHLANEKMNIADLEREIKEIANKIEGFSYEDMDKNIEEFKNQINKELDKINSAFEKISKNHKEEVRLITIKYYLNEDIFEGVFEDFDKLVDKEFNIQKHQSKIKEYLKEIELKSVIGMQHTEFTEKLDNLIENKKAAFYETMKDIFDRESHFQIYRLFVLKHLRNVEKYKIFEVRYDKRALNETSFGQRCTAVLIVLLSLGNNPIIIDEPEAHLDSTLIAKYLVTLIKERKQERQIIFATHNANFVLNADAELIIQLKNENNKIIAQSFTIESDRYRDDLLKLEGGEEAFKNRERKYGITKDKN